MTTAIKRRRGTTAEHATFTGLEGELTVDTSKDTVVVHDGSTAGGSPLAKEDGSTMTNVDINSGTIDGTTIGGTTAAAGTFTNLTATGTVTFDGITTSADLNFGDNDKAVFGAGSDLQVYHSGTHSWINENGTGNLYIQSSGAAINVTNGSSRNLAQFNTSAGTATLFHDNGTTSSAKLATTASGIDVTGTVTADGLNVGDNHTIQDDANDNLTISSSTGEFVIVEGAGGVLVRQGASDTNAIRIADGGDISFYADNGSTQALFFDASTQRLGLGTTSPSSIFHTEENTTSTSIVRHKNTSNTSGAHSRLILQNGGTSGGDALINLDTQASGSRFTLGVDRSASKFVVANADKGSFDGSDEAFVITSGGNVGIGATTVDRLLHIEGSNGTAYSSSDFDQTYNLMKIENTNTSTNSATGIQFLVGSNGSAAISATRTGDGEASLCFGTRGGGARKERLRIDSSGNVGIGTAAPAHNVEIVATNAGSVNDSLQIRNNATSTGTGSRIRFINSTDANSDANGASIASVRTGNDNDLVFETENSEKMRILHNGRIGIGTSSPGQELHVSGTGSQAIGVGSTNAGGAYLFLDGDSNGDFVGADYCFVGQDDAGVLNIHQDSPSGTNEIRFSTAGTEAVRIDSSGNLLVGTTDSFPGDGDTNTGIALAASGSAAFSRDGFRVVSVNRNTSDGTLVEFNKDGSEVGSIGSFNGNAYYAGTGCGLRPRTGDISPTNASGSTNDGGVDLGTSSNRFQNIWLSGGAYLGGTATANKLDDYEEGSVTGITDQSGAGLSFIFNAGNYVKVGTLVHFELDFSFPTTTDGSTAQIGALPFTFQSNFGSGTLGYHTRGADMTVYSIGNTQNLRFASNLGANQTNAQMSGVRVILAITYRST